MNYKSVNELNKFTFQDAQLMNLSIENDTVTFELEAVIVKATNSANEMMCDSYAGTMALRFVRAEISQLFLEGYRYYDADNVLQKTVPDTPIPLEDYRETFRKLKRGYLYEPEKTGENTYMIGVDLEEGEDTYWFTLKFERVIAEWDRYMNKVQSE
ncbi:MAG: hypothetical protein HFG80_08725 [Eubacterium sp.]|nr:hypothetical protein [Eubacterium sp.]